MGGHLRRRWSNYTQKGAFTGIGKFKRATCSKLSARQIANELRKIETYRLHFPVRKNYPRRVIYVGGINKQWYIDLADIQKHSGANNRKRFILTAIDAFSKKGWLEAVPHKTGIAVAKALEKIFIRARVSPRKIQSDKGTEFYNSHVKQLFKRYGVVLFSVSSDKKACIAERFIRTIFGIIRKFTTKYNTKKFVHRLPYFEKIYNNSYHRSIKMAPAEVTAENEATVYSNLYKRTPPAYSLPKFHIGDAILVVKRKNTFEKGYDQTFLKEIFYISRIQPTIPTTYILEDKFKNPIKGSFYTEQLISAT
jgi:transposase InsO family protein